MTEQTSAKIERPLSPHLQVYRLPFIAITSILHRASGAFLSMGLVAFTWWLVAASIGPEAYDCFMQAAGSPLGLFVLLGFTGAFYFHMANGIRHLFWDAGFLFKLKNANAAGVFVLFSAAAMTAITWICAFTYGGISL